MKVRSVEIYPLVTSIFTRRVCEFRDCSKRQAYRVYFECLYDDLVYPERWLQRRDYLCSAHTEDFCQQHGVPVPWHKVQGEG